MNKPHIPLFLECTPMTHNGGTLFQRFSTYPNPCVHRRNYARSTQRNIPKTSCPFCRNSFIEINVDKLYDL